MNPRNHLLWSLLMATCVIVGGAASSTVVPPPGGGMRGRNATDDVLEVFVDDSEVLPDPQYREAAYIGDLGRRRSARVEQRAAWERLLRPWLAPAK